MSKDISRQFTKEQIKKCGRKGFDIVHGGKITVISPAKYGMFIANKRNK